MGIVRLWNLAKEFIGVSGDRTRWRDPMVKARMADRLGGAEILVQPTMEEIEWLERVLSTTIDRGRALSDSEVKLLHRIVKMIEEGEIPNGERIKLFTEREPCRESCEQLIEAFKRKYGPGTEKNITLNVEFTHVWDPETRKYVPLPPPAGY